MYMQDLVILIGTHRLMKLEVQVIQISFVKSLLRMRNIVKPVFCNLLGDLMVVWRQKGKYGLKILTRIQ